LCLWDPTNELLAQELFQIISRATCAVCRIQFRLICSASELDSPTLEDVNPRPDAERDSAALATQRRRGLLKSIPPTFVPPTCEEAAESAANGITHPYVLMLSSSEGQRHFDRFKTEVPDQTPTVSSNQRFQLLPFPRQCPRYRTQPYFHHWWAAGHGTP